MKQLSKNQAIAIGKGGEWKDWTEEEIVKFQLYQKRLCMPFDVFHKAVTNVLGRPVWIHEFGGSGWYALQGEYEGKRPAPTFEEIAAMIPEEKRMILRI